MPTEVSPDDLMPANAAEPTTPEPKAEKADEGGGEIPDAVLEAAPALQLLLNGSPPATFAPKDAEFPEIEVVAKHIKDLGKAGFGVYPTKDGANVVVFNGLYVTPEQVAAADEAGQLDQIAAPYAELRTALEGGTPSAGATETSPDASGAASMPPIAPAPSGGGPSAGTEKKIAQARLKNSTLGTPTSGPAPGQGRILNNIAKPVV